MSHQPNTRPVLVRNGGIEGRRLDRLHVTTGELRGWRERTAAPGVVGKGDEVPCPGAVRQRTRADLHPRKPAQFEVLKQLTAGGGRRLEGEHPPRRPDPRRRDESKQPDMRAPIDETIAGSQQGADKRQVRVFDAVGVGGEPEAALKVDPYPGASAVIREDGVTSGADVFARQPRQKARGGCNRSFPPRRIAEQPCSSLRTQQHLDGVAARMNHFAAAVFHSCFPGAPPRAI
jgi:hypothetical protein